MEKENELEKEKEGEGVIGEESRKRKGDGGGEEERPKKKPKQNRNKSNRQAIYEMQVTSHSSQSHTFGHKNLHICAPSSFSLTEYFPPPLLSKFALPLYLL